MDTGQIGSVAIAGYYRNHTVTRTASGVIVTNKITGVSTTYPGGIQLIKFVDKHVDFDVDGPSGQIYRMYQAAFNRKPDSEGLGFWLKKAQHGMSVRDIAAEFLKSAEFETLYGKNPSAQAFVSALYQNILHRAPDKAGYDYWVGMVSGGTDHVSVLVDGFAESAENKKEINPTIVGGFAYDYYREAGDPILPKRSSYQNKQAAFAATGPIVLPTFTNGEIIGTGFAMADFFQNGEFSLVTNTTDFSAKSAAAGYTTLPGKIYFYTRTASGWVDRTSELLSDQSGCISPRKMVVADFNGDGRPDVFIACTGLDTNNSPMEHSRFLISQPDGRYTNTTTSFICYCHSASAADVDADGYADLVLADPGKFMRPTYLVNQKDGRFIPDTSRMPSSVNAFSYPGQTTLFALPIYTVELLDLKGRGLYDLFVGANEPNSYVHPMAADTPANYYSSIYWSDGTGHFSDAGRFAIPNLDPTYGLPLDVAFDGQRLYLLRVVDDVDSPLGFYGGVAVQELAISTLASTTKYTHTGTYLPGNDGQNWKWFPWIEVNQGHLRSYDAAYPVDLTL